MAKPQYNTREHKALRLHYRGVIDEGNGWCAELVCLLPDRCIKPGSPFDLAHDRRTVGAYLGPSHPACNRAEGARWGNSRRHVTASTPSRWAL